MHLTTFPLHLLHFPLSLFFFCTPPFCSHWHWLQAWICVIRLIFWRAEVSEKDRSVSGSSYLRGKKKEQKLCIQKAGLYVITTFFQCFFFLKSKMLNLPTKTIGEWCETRTNFIWSVTMRYHMTMVMICNEIIFLLLGWSTSFICGGVVHVMCIHLPILHKFFNYFSSIKSRFSPFK